MIFVSIAIIVTMGYSQCGRASQFQAMDSKGQRLAPFAKVGNVELPVAWVEKAQEDTIKQQLGGNTQLLDQLPPTFTVGIYANAVGQVVERGYALEAALRQGVKIEEEDVKKELTLEKFTQEARDQLVNSGQLKADATPAQFDEVVKKLTQGKTIAEIHKMQMDELTKAFADAEKKPLLQAEFATQLALQKIRDSIKPTDDQVKKGFEKLTLKRIVTRQDEAKAKKAYDEIKAGKTFEAAMDAYSDDFAPQGKKKSESSQDVPSSYAARTPDFKAVTTLKPGEISPVTKTQEGFVIYKLVAVKPDVPADFEKSKAKYVKAFASEEAAAKFKEEVDKLKKDIQPQFELKAYEAAYLFAKGSMTGSETTPEEVKNAYELAKGVNENEPGGELAAMIAVAAFQRIYDEKGADKLKLKPERIATLEKFLKFKDNWDMRKEVIEAYKNDKKGDEALNQLLTALDKNSKYDQEGQRIYSDVAAKFGEIKSLNLIKPEQEKEFRSRQEEWQKAKADYDKTEAELAKQQKEQEAKDKAAAKSQAPASSAPAKK